MEAFTHTCSSCAIAWPSGKAWSLAGVVGSGNLEVLIEQDAEVPGSVVYSVETSIPGYRDSWVAGFEDFSRHYAVGGTRVTIHDQGAAPIVVMMRLRQALDQLSQP